MGDNEYMNNVIQFKPRQAKMNQSEMINGLEQATVNGDTQGMKNYMIALLELQLNKEDFPRRIDDIEID